MKKLLTFLALFTNCTIYSAQYTVFGHGIVDGPLQAERFQQAFATPQIAAIEFPDAKLASDWGVNGIIGHCTKLFGKMVNRSAMFMGQTADITAICQTMAQLPAKQSVILYGCSRGSAAIINYLAEYNPNNVKAVVLDSCPANLPETIAPKLANLGIDPAYNLSIFRTLFPAYPENSIAPIKAIQHIAHKNIPILLIHSKDDTVVPYPHSLQLYQEFKKQGFTNVHLATIPQGRHSFLLQSDSAKSDYLTAVHSFYKKYGLPYDASWASDALDADNPDIFNIQEIINDYESDILKQYKLAKKRNLIAIAAIVTIGAILYSKNYQE